MSVRNTVRALPTLLRIGIAEAVAYRAEFLIWILSTTMPLVMLAMWSAVAHDAPIGRFGEKDFVLYFLATFIVRQLASSWTSWQINFEVRTGILSMRLLRPIHPIWSYAIENIAALPMRLIVAIPIAAIALYVAGSSKLPANVAMWGLFCVSLLGAWMITFLAGVAIGTLCLFMESSAKVMDVWLTGFFVFSGYTIPVELFPKTLQDIASYLPFRYQVGLPVEILTSAHDFDTAIALIGRQWIFVALLIVITWFVWDRGLRRFAAYGG